MTENAVAGKRGGGIASNARKELEEKTGKRVITGENFLPPARSQAMIDGEKADAR